jgi:hypothetical protein
LNIYFESIGIKCFDYWYFCFIKKKLNSSSKTLQIAHSLWSLGILRFLPISIKSLRSLSLNFVKISLDVINNIPFHFHFVLRIYTSIYFSFDLSFLFLFKIRFLLWSFELSFMMCLYWFTSLIVWYFSVDSISKPISDTIFLA